MTKIILRKTTNAIFLAIVLIAGTFAALSPSFMVGAQAQQFNGMDERYNSYQPEYGTDNKYNSYEPEYGMNSYDHKQSYKKDSNSYDKSKDSNNVIVKKNKCNNIIVNLNGFNGALPTSDLGALATDEAQAEDEGANGVNSGNDGRGDDGRGDDGRPSGHDSNSRFVCINNNNYNVGGETPEPLNCEECFEENLSPEQVIAFEAFLENTLPIAIGGEIIEINNIADLCEALEIATTEVSVEFIAILLNGVLTQGGITDIDVREDIILCVGDALGIDIPIIS